MASFLNILYGYQLFDGCLTTRDLGYLLREGVKGICFDISRAAQGSMDYGALECAKNGLIVTGKYAGRVRRFEIVPVVVFANFFPNVSRLSQDRWQILTIGEGELDNSNKTPLISPAEEFPFLRPPAMPDLSDDFSLRAFLDENLPSRSVDRRAVTRNDNSGGVQLSGVHVEQVIQTSVASVDSVLSGEQTQIPQVSHIVCKRHPNPGKFIYLVVKNFTRRILVRKRNRKLINC